MRLIAVLLLNLYLPISCIVNMLNCLFSVSIKVSNLRQRFFHSIAPGGLAGDRRGVVPASGFSFSVQQIWKIIKENKDLDLPAHKVTFLILLFGII